MSRRFNKAVFGCAAAVNFNMTPDCPTKFVKVIADVIQLCSMAHIKKTNNTTASPRLTIRLLGAPQLILNEQPLEILRRKNRALVYYLAAHPRPTSRENILAFFWPDHARTAAQQILRTMVHDLRKQFGSMLILEKESLAVEPAADIDLHQFEKSLAATNIDAVALTTALGLYRGDFVDGFTLVDTPSFDDWVFSERERLRLLFIRGLAKLAQHYETRRDWRTALNTLERALKFDPLQEELERAALRLLYLSGDRPGAIRRYDAFCKLLNNEMGVPPMPETRALYDAIITDTLLPDVPTSPIDISTIAPRAIPSKDQLPFVGRMREMDMLTQIAPTGKLILIEGEPGIGKTRLALEFISRNTNALVLSSVAHELEQGLPYQPIVEAMRGLVALTEWDLIRSQLELVPVWQDVLARLVPDLFPASTPSSSSGEESKLWEALYRFVLGLAQARHVIFMLDDLQWADTSTLGWLGYLLRHPIPPPFVLIATARTNEMRPAQTTLLQTLTREDRLARLSLDTLTPADLRNLAERIDPTQAESFSDWLTRNTEGNPFFVNELVRYTNVRSGAAIRTVSGHSVPASIHNLISARLAHLSNPARRVLEAAAIIGREFDARLVMRVSTLDEDSVLDTFDELRTAALIQSRGHGHFSFDHHLTMQVVLQEMSDLRRIAQHRHVAEALEQIHRNQLDPIAGLIAHHWALADTPARVASFAFRAGKYAASLAAWTEAIAFYDQALATETDAAQRTAILLALCFARINHGDMALASEAARSAIALAQEHEDWVHLEEAQLILNMSLYPQGRYTEAISIAQELRQSCPPDLILAAEFMWGMALSLQSAHPIEAEFHLREAEKLMTAPRSFESNVTLATLKYQLAGPLAQQGKNQEAIALYRQALVLLSENRDTLDLQRQILLYNNLAYNLHLEHDPAAAEYARAGLQLAREKGTLTHQSYLLSTSGEIALAQNDWGSAQDFFAEGLKIAEQLNIPERIAGLTANLGRVASMLGDPNRARELLTDALKRADQIGASHLSVRIRIWLTPLVSKEEKQQRLREARAIAESSSYARLLEEIAELEHAATI